MSSLWLFAIVVVFFSAHCWLCHGIQDVIDKTSTMRTIQRLKANNAAEVIIVSNFLPLSLAESWREQLLQKWEELDETDDSDFLYATNERNTKVRSLDKIKERRNRAWKKKLTGQFSYGKWELNPVDPLILEISDYMLRNDSITFISDVLGLNSNVNAEQVSTEELSDLFVSHFATGDFLSAHSDFYSGTYAFVVSLTAGMGSEEWSEEGYGGQLALLCADKPPRSSFPPICHHIPPVFNQLVLFRTRPGPIHSVEAVVKEGYAKGFRRLAFTGWFMGASDTFSEKELHQRNEMRGTTATKKSETHANENKRRRKKIIGSISELRRMNQ